MERTWLDALPQHSIFSNSNSSNTQDSLHSEQLLPPSPGLSTVASFTGDDSTLNLHASTSLAGNGAAAASSTSNPKGKRRATCVVRKTELLVAVGSSIRLGDLAHFKTRVEASTAAAGSWNNENASNVDDTATDYASGSSTLGSFKTLATPAIDFEILSLVPSPSSRYVAAVGASQVAVVQIPLRGWNSLVGRSIECSQDPVGPFYHARSSETIAKVAFHPWGIDDSTLLVLTSDGLLREYDILQDPEEPTQVIDFSQVHGDSSIPPAGLAPHRGVRYGLNSSIPRRRERTSSATPTRRRSRSRSRSRSRTRSVSRAISSHGLNGKTSTGGTFGDRDDTSTRAAAFCFGKGNADWSPFTLYCLMQNGDLYCVCPYLPKSARIPALLLESLLGVTSAKINHLLASGPAAQLSLYERRDLEAEYGARLKFLKSLLDPQVRDRAEDMDDMSLELDEEHVKVAYPTYLRTTPARQGPFLLQPAPRDLESDEDEPLASDMEYILVEPEATETNEGADFPLVGVLLMSYENGKVDVCVDVARVEASWSKQSSETTLPCLMVQESIDLLGPHRTHLSDGPVQLLFDPEYPDVVYAQHNLGVHCVSLQALFEMFKRTTSNQDDDLLNSLTHTIHQASVSWVVQESLDRSDQSFLEDAPVGVSIIDDVYLGYAIIVMHANMHVTTAELALRSERANGFDIEGADQLVLDKLQPGKTEDSSSSTYSAFSGAPPFTLPPLLTKTGASQRLSTRYASPPPTSSRGVRATKSTQPSMELTAEMLQFVGTTTEGLDKSIKDLISAGNAVQGRLGLQMEEIPRQIEKLNLVSAALDDKSAQMNQFFDERLNSVQKRQHEITSRADHILQKLIDLSQPDLSIYEKQWLEELGRVKQTVGSAAERKSLESRAERLREQLDVLRPDLEQLQRDKESVSRPNSQDRLGEAQRKRIEAALAEESRLVADARAKIAKLQSRIAIASRSAGVVVR